jgi:uncharacterized membrane protein YfcA
MGPLQYATLVVAGTVAGTMNTVVGAGSLVTFPVLLAFGLPPVTANVTNNVGIFPGSISGAIAYRRELSRHRAATGRLAVVSAASGAIGALLLLALPTAAFRGIVPVMIATSCVLVLFQPRLNARFGQTEPAEGSPRSPALLYAGVLVTGVYGGYFGAAQGVLLLALLGVFGNRTLQTSNAMKNALAATVNTVAAVVFVLLAHVEWAAAGCVAVGAVAGGQFGAAIARRLPDTVFKVAIVGFGLAAIVYLVH